MKTTLCIAMLMLAPVMTARADLKTDAPAVVTEYLSAWGLSTNRGWREYEDVGWMACSSYRRLTAGDGPPPPDNLAYYCTGEASRVTEVRIVLAMFSRAMLPEHTGLMADVAGDLCRKATGAPLPQQMRNAVFARKPWTMRSGGWQMQVTRTQGAQPDYVFIEFSIAAK